ncbi:phage tail protein [Staphylococcus shinii]|uniref:phage tail protein n=1 Tax=Staphylococcus shinii TaxID=2912228 RepID=UPI00298F2E48|nr:phage tail protein [Staphylococcus shinii]MDW8564711.1 phage tail protein [Staphylococcus shinii]
MAQKNYIAVVRPADDKLDNGEGLLLADLQEGGHTIESDLAEIVRAGKMDYGVNSTSEEIKLTVGHIPGDAGQEQVKVAIKNGKQLRVWVIETKKREDVYNAIFAYVQAESYEMSFDDEDDTIELTLKVKWNSADGGFTELPEEWLNPSASAELVEFEQFGEKTGSYENQKELGTGA